MTQRFAPHGSFRAKVLCREEALIGTFVKCASYEVVEVLIESGLDFLVPDFEHAPFSAQAFDLCAALALGVDFPLLPRVRGLADHEISVLIDSGAAGIILPHLNSAQKSEELARKLLIGGGKRGFSPSTRAARRMEGDMAEKLRALDGALTIVGQIEDAEALCDLEAICQVPDLDLLMVGPVDLALSLGCATSDVPKVQAAIAYIAEVAQRHGKALGIALGDNRAIGALQDLGYRIFIIGSDQAFLRKAAQSISVTRGNHA